MPEFPQPETQPQPESVHLAQQVAARLAEFATDVVLCPGSRNAPLSLALIAHPGCGFTCVSTSAALLSSPSVWRACSSDMLRW